MSKSVRELELIIMRLKSQIEAKTEQIEGMNKYLREASAETQRIISEFRAFCAKILENELAYSNITTKELQNMPLEELLKRAQDAHKQNQMKSREIYEAMKKKLMDKNQIITGLTDQVTQLKIMLDNAAEIFSGTEIPSDPDTDRAAAYLVETESSVDDIRPALGGTDMLEEGEKVFDMATNITREADTVTGSKTVPKGGKEFKVVDVQAIRAAMSALMWDYIKVIGETGLTEYSEIRTEVIRRYDRKPSESTVYNAHNSLLASGLITAEKVVAGSRWFLATELTQLGTQLYTEQYKKAPAESEMKRLIREHDNVRHGYAIKDVSRILTDTGRYRSVSTKRRANTITLDGNKRCIPDIVCCGDGQIDYYEVDCGNHQQADFEDKCNKLKSITKNLYFVAPTRDEMMERLKPQIEKWIASCGGPLALSKSGVMVYLTSIYDLSGGKWVYIYNMEREEPLCLVRIKRKGTASQPGKE